MSRDDLLTVVYRQLKDVVAELELSEIDGNTPLREYGVSSIDLVEIVASVTAELQIRIARADLRNVSTLNELIDALAHALDE